MKLIRNNKSIPIKRIRSYFLGAFSHRDDSIYKMIDMKLPLIVKEPVTNNIVEKQIETPNVRSFIRLSLWSEANEQWNNR